MYGMVWYGMVCVYVCISNKIGDVIGNKYYKYNIEIGKFDHKNILI